MPDDATRYDVAVIGGGIVGLSAAMELAGRYPGLGVCVLEKEAAPGQHQTGHNSGVIHSGLYYRPGTARARLAVRGAREMLAFCAAHHLPHEQCGKVVVATTRAESARLDTLLERGMTNGVPGLQRLTPAALREREPQAAGIAALLAPSTGITDFGAVARTYAVILAERGGVLRTGAAVRGVHRDGDGFRLHTRAGAVRTRSLVNCAGLHADRIARLCGIEPGLRIMPFRGEYYALRPEARSLARHLIYPVPNPAFPFLGVHFTRRINGAVEAGPNAVPALAREGYGWSAIDPGAVLETLRDPGAWRLARRYWRAGAGEIWRSWRKPAFVAALRRLLPAIEASDLVRAGAGVRAQAIDAQGNLLDDFHWVEAERMLHVLNAPSPAATASLGIGQAIADRAAAWLGPPAARTPEAALG